MVALPAADLLAVVALVNECRDLGDDPVGWRRHLADRLAELGDRQAVAAATEALLDPLVGGPLARPGDPSPADLSARERDVLRYLLEGRSDKQIAARLGVTRYTVNQHTKRIYKHFGARGRGELLARWVRRGWAGGRPGW